MISDETRKKQSESHKGKKHTDEEKRKLSIYGKSQKNLEHLRKVSEGNCNKPRSDETKCNISFTKTGYKPIIIKTNCAYCGKIITVPPSRLKRYKNHYCCKEHYHLAEHHRSEETKRKTSETLKGRSKNYPTSKETREKLSISAKTSPLAQKQMQTLHEAQIGKERSLITREKQSNALRKDKTRKWFDGITALYKQIRNHSKMMAWKNAVFKKDNYKDYYSGCSPTQQNPLEAHHILQFWRIIDIYNIKTLQDALKCAQLWDVNNGISLLKSSHRAYHDMYGNDYE